MKADRFFTEEENKKITAAIRDVESRTDGEIAVMVVDSSNHYHEAEVLAGVILGSLLALIVTVLFFHDSLWVYIALSILLFFPFCLALCPDPPIKGRLSCPSEGKKKWSGSGPCGPFMKKGFIGPASYRGFVFYFFDGKKGLGPGR